MRRVLHISKYYYPYIGGVEDVCFNIVKILKRQPEIEQQVFCFNDVNVTVNDIFDDVPVRRVAIKKVVASQPLSTCYRAELRALIESFKPTHIHFHAPNPLAAYHLLAVIPRGVKLIIHWHSDIVAQKLIYAVIKPIETRLLKRADLILATSPTYINGSVPLQRFRDKVDVLQNVIEPEKFELTAELNAQITAIKVKYSNLPIVLFVGRHVPYKGISHLIDAAAKVTAPCMFVIGGKGPLTEELKVSAKELQNVQFIGRIDEDELAAYFYAADIFAFPSITKNEAFGVALAEAMYCNTPAVTYTIDGSGVNWVNIGGETGIEVANSDTEALAEAIDTLLNDNELSARYAANARNRVETLMTASVIGDKLVALYLENPVRVDPVGQDT